MRNNYNKVTYDKIPYNQHIKIIETEQKDSSMNLVDIDIDDNLNVQNYIKQNNNENDDSTSENNNNVTENNDLKKEIENKKEKIYNLDINNILTNLKIISHIKKGEKISINNENYVEIDNRYVQCFRRWYDNNSRNTTIEFINIIINELFKSIDKTYNNKNTETQYFNEDNNVILQQFLIGMIDVCKGLNNLKDTYSNDITTTSQLDMIITRIHQRIGKIQKILKI